MFNHDNHVIYVVPSFFFSRRLATFFFFFFDPCLAAFDAVILKAPKTEEMTAISATVCYPFMTAIEVLSSWGFTWSMVHSFLLFFLFLSSFHSHHPLLETRTLPALIAQLLLTTYSRLLNSPFNQNNAVWWRHRTRCTIQQSLASLTRNSSKITT